MPENGKAVALRDYELVELKLGVAHDEGSAANAGACGEPTEVQSEILMPGLSALCVPVGGVVIRLVALTDDFDLNLLGFETGPDWAVLLVHQDDLEYLIGKGVRIRMDTFRQKGALPGWYFRTFPWHDANAMREALLEILPDLTPS